LEQEKLSRERQIESLEQRQCETERGISEVISQATQSVEEQRQHYENRLRQLESELAEHQLKAALCEHDQHLTDTELEVKLYSVYMLCIISFILSILRSAIAHWLVQWWKVEDYVQIGHVHDQNSQSNVAVNMSDTRHEGATNISGLSCNRHAFILAVSGMSYW